MKKLLLISALLVVAVSVVVVRRPAAQNQYVPQAQLCADGSGKLCTKVPAYIGPDPELSSAGVGYEGLFGSPPTSSNTDVQTPFDNMAWQMFVALNWPVEGLLLPPDQGLTKPGPRVFQTYTKVNTLFGESPNKAKCTPKPLQPVFYIGSDGKGKPSLNNEEYFQASTNLPLIDINQNWTIFERRVNLVETNFLLQPGNPSQTLTTTQGQTNFIKNNPGGVQFTASSTTQTGTPGSIEIKTAWRIINQAAGDDPSRYFTQDVLIAVAGDLVNGGSDVCANVTVGLVGMHIVQRNPVDSNNAKLLPQWIWATFEHVDNAPLAQSPCTVSNGCGTSQNTNWINQPSCGSAAPSTSVRYSYYNQNAGTQATNIRPKSTGSGTTTFPWNAAQPYAKGNTTSGTGTPQATRCFSIYPTTAQLNTQWQAELAKVNTPLQNYMLIGTQWGANVEPERGNPIPADAVPGMLSNTTLETYIQNYTKATTDGGPGSCIGCHKLATLAVGNPAPSADFSFLPGLAKPATARSKIKTPR